MEEDFDALLDQDSFSNVDYDALERDARSYNPPSVLKPAPKRMHSLSVPKPYRPTPPAPNASTSRNQLGNHFSGPQPPLSQTTLWGSQPIHVKQAPALDTSAAAQPIKTVAVKVSNILRNILHAD